MKARSAAIQGGLAGVALLAAFAVWQREPEATSTGDEVVALDLGRSDLTAVRLQTPAATVEVKREGDVVWIHSAPAPAPPPPLLPAADAGTAADAGVPSFTPPPPPPPPPPREMKGNELAEKTLEKFAPLRALRSLGKLPGEKLKELGLDEPKRTLTVVQRGGREHVFKVGNALPGVGSPYLQGADGTVYLVASIVISQLEGASTQLVDRRLHAFKQQEVDGLLVKAGDKQRELVQTLDDQGAVRVASKKAPDKPDDFSRNWSDKVWRLMSVEVLGKGETPATGEPKVEGRVEYLRHGKPLGFVDLGRGAKGELYLRSEHTAGWVKTYQHADDVLGEIKKVLEPG